MEPGQYQMQSFVSAVVIVAAAIIALICDFLKRNNEQLRELTIELKVRREAEQKREHLLTPHMPERIERAPRTEKIAAPPAPAAPKERSALGNEKKRTNSEALAAMERGAALAGSGGCPRSTAVAPVAQPKPESKPEVVVVRQETAKQIARKDWGSLLSRKPAAATNQSAQAAEQSLPAGFQDGFVLSKLVESRQPISGLVVSIGVNAARNSDGTVSDAVAKLVQSLIGPDDFAAQSSDEEFLLIYPEERGASAQRRLSQIAQQLWDFQLRSLGSFQILFSWGGVEVLSESIEEAIASASERMQETKRGRKLLTMASPAQSCGNDAQLRQAV
jgi:hypothetical protein